MSDTEHRWLAKVLAGDPVACGVLTLARDLADAEWNTFARCVEQMRVGVPAVNAEAALWQECDRMLE
jgi:hypothetical protein